MSYSEEPSGSQTMRRVRHGSKNCKARRKGKTSHAPTEHRSTQTDRRRWGESGRCVGSDPYWPHQALAGRCTPRSGQRSQIAAGRRPRSAACRAFPQTASCLLDGKREGRGKIVGRGKEEAERRLQLMATFCSTHRNFYSSLSKSAGSAHWMNSWCIVHGQTSSKSRLF